MTKVREIIHITKKCSWFGVRLSLINEINKARKSEGFFYSSGSMAVIDY